MKAIISTIDPTGVKTKTEEFEFPLFKPYQEKVVTLVDGKTYLSESMLQVRYHLEFNGFEYIFYKTGPLELVEDKKC